LFIDYITGAITANEDEEVIFINIDQSLALGGDIAAYEVVTTEGGASVIGLEVGVQIAPIKQLSGVFGNMDSALNNTSDVLAAFVSETNNTPIFTDDNDFVTIGNTEKFEEIEFLLEVMASGAGIQPTFAFSTGVDAWDEFNPADGTNGMRDNGVMIWLDSDIPTWAVGTDSEFLIMINRTRNTLATTPVERKVQIAAATQYFWDKNGSLLIKEINASGNVTASFLIGDGSLLTGIAGGSGIWENVSGQARYSDDVNITGDLYIGNNSDGNEGKILVGLGDVTNPSYGFSNLGNIGMYQDAFSTLAFSTVGIKRMSINNAGLTTTPVGSPSSPSIAIGNDNIGLYRVGTDRLGIVAGIVEFIRLHEEAGQDELIFNVESKDVDFRVESDDKTHMFFIDGNNNFIGINTSTPSFALEVWGNATDSISIWADGNISAQEYITRTSIYNPKKGSVWGWIRNATDYKTDGDIVHDRFYGAVTYQKIDTSRPINVSVTEEECEIDENDKEICQNVTATVIEYPFKMDESGVALGKEIDVLRQAVFELKQENDLMKAELCTFQQFYSWC